MPRTRVPSFLLVAAVALLQATTAAASVLISELCDPRLDYTTDRFIEIANTGATDVDLAGWSLVAYGNGSPVFTWQLSGTIAAGDALVAGDATTVDAFPVDFADEQWSNNDGLWNGKVGDGVRLLDASQAVVDDVVVDATRFENMDYVRHFDVTGPNAAYDPAEWTGTSVDRPSQGSPGSHSTEPPVPVPTITSVAIDPAAPLPGQPVLVRAIVTDDVASLTSVVLSWGPTAASLPNDVPMSVLYGNVWSTDTPIPGQAAGATVFYRIEAFNDVPASTATPVASYAVPEEVAIRDLQGEADVSPYAGLPVVTHGVVTGVVGGYVALQDGSGPWGGVWMTAPVPSPARGDSLTVRALVTETAGGGFAGTTLLTDPLVLASSPDAALPTPAFVSTAALNDEQWEGVLLLIANAMCTEPDLGDAWEADDGSGEGAVGELAGDPSPILGTVYAVLGVGRESGGAYRIEPRGPDDVYLMSDPTPPSLVRVTATDATSVLAFFSEPVGLPSAENAANYTIPGLSVAAAARDASDPSQVALTVAPMPVGPYELTVAGVGDLHGNYTTGTTGRFEYVDYGPPPGYYDAAAGLTGEALRAALHDIIKDHTVRSYDFAWTAYYTTDDKPNGKVWDIYSDVPDGTPPYEYTFGVDEGGVGGGEGNGYTREHSFPKSWFGGEVTPMYSDLFALYPCDAHVNGNRGTYPYAEVDLPDWTSLNGSKRGPCSTPGYTGTAFEPIDAYKGDLARTYFYMSTRYDTEDAAWPGGPMTDGADLLPWARDMLLEWAEQDPVSRKEIERNGTVYGFQGNRNPYIDHPEYAELVFGDVTAAGDAPAMLPALRACAPNPFNPSTEIRFSLPRRTAVRIDIHDALGRLVRRLVDDTRPAGVHTATWNGRDDAGRAVASGVYFCRMRAEGYSGARKLVLVR